MYIYIYIYIYTEEELTRNMTSALFPEV